MTLKTYAVADRAVERVASADGWTPARAKDGSEAHRLWKVGDDYVRSHRICKEPDVNGGVLRVFIQLAKSDENFNMAAGSNGKPLRVDGVITLPTGEEVRKPGGAIELHIPLDAGRIYTPEELADLVEQAEAERVAMFTNTLMLDRALASI